MSYYSNLKKKKSNQSSKNVFFGKVINVHSFRICDFGSEISENLVHHTLSICLGIQFRQCSVILLKKEGEKKRINFFNTFGFARPWDQSLLDPYSILFKVYFWLNYGWQIVSFWWYFHNFHKNEMESCSHCRQHFQIVLIKKTDFWTIGFVQWGSQ